MKKIFHQVISHFIQKFQINVVGLKTQIQNFKEAKCQEV